ncbi:hypothetical protein CSA80_01540 [Candidatus Saccharibacteria bacterium]|nr:MAG: hypothetical protein CSA80_01540 [Candidatus Saccharibacteria bacterium]
MEKRDLIGLFFLTLFTLGFYGIYWEVKTKGEMNARGADIPTAWLLLVPIVNLWWLWKYSEGVERVTGGKMSGLVAFLLIFVLGIIGMLVIQDAFNKAADMEAAAQAAPAAPVASGTDATPPQPPVATT